MRVHASLSHDVFQVKVVDTGVGIEAENVSGIFEAFAQADKTVSSNYGGTGLGLSISKQLCRLMGGTISLHSELGVGSEFTVQLPVSNR